MRSLSGYYYDGKSSARTEVTLSCLGDRLQIAGNGIDTGYYIRDIHISSGIGVIHRTIRFPDGSQCEIAGGLPLDGLLAGQGSGLLQRLLHRWERSLPLALLALLLTVGLVTILVKYGIPAAAKRVAFSLSPATDAALGSEALGVLDRLVFAPSKLPADRQRQVRSLFLDIVRDLPGRIDVLVRQAVRGLPGSRRAIRTIRGAECIRRDVHGRLHSALSHLGSKLGKD